jgi:hypothetical protein
MIARFRSARGLQPDSTRKVSMLKRWIEMIAEMIAETIAA